LAPANGEACGNPPPGVKWSYKCTRGGQEAKNAGHGKRGEEGGLRLSKGTTLRERGGWFIEKVMGVAKRGKGLGQKASRATP